MRRVLYVCVCLSTPHVLHTLEGGPFPTSRTIGSQLGSVQLGGSRSAYGSKPAVNVNAALESDEPIYDHRNTNSMISVQAEHTPPPQHQYSQAASDQAVFQAPTQQIAQSAVQVETQRPNLPSPQHQYSQAASDQAVFQAPTQKIAQSAVQVETQRPNLGEKPSVKEILTVAPVQFSYKKLNSCASILQNNSQQNPEEQMPENIATSFASILSEITGKISSQTEKNILNIFESLNAITNDSFNTLRHIINTCEVDEDGRNVFQRLIRVNMVRALQSDFIKALLLESEEVPFLVLDKNNNNVLHLAVMTGNVNMVNAVMALHDVYQREKMGHASNRVTFLASALEGKNNVGKKPIDLAKGFNLLILLQSLYRLGALHASIMSKD